VREKLIEFLQRRHPHALPKLRTEFQGDALLDKRRLLQTGRLNR
jgi:hypothetical protein